MCRGILVSVCVCNTELSNLLVMRHGADRSNRADSLSLNMTQLRFHQIKDREIVQVKRPTCHICETLFHSLLTYYSGVVFEQEQHLGRGTRTNMYSGRLLVRGGDNDEDDEFNNNFADSKGIPVVLKILDQSHKDIALVSLVTFVLHYEEIRVMVAYFNTFILGIF